MSFYFVTDSKSLKMYPVFLHSVNLEFVWDNFGVGMFGIYSKIINLITYIFCKKFICIYIFQIH